MRSCLSLSSWKEFVWKSLLIITFFGWHKKTGEKIESLKKKVLGKNWKIDNACFWVMESHKKVVIVFVHSLYVIVVLYCFTSHFFTHLSFLPFALPRSHFSKEFQERMKPMVKFDQKIKKEKVNKRNKKRGWKIQKDRRWDNTFKFDPEGRFMIHASNNKSRPVGEKEWEKEKENKGE